MLSLEDAKLHLNMELDVTVDDAELAATLAAAVRRVDRHLFTPAERAAGVTLVGQELLPEQRLAVLTVVAEFWRPQRPRAAAGSAVSSAAVDRDTGPDGRAPLTARLTELLGPPVPETNLSADAAAAPRGGFPSPVLWPDPARPSWRRA